MDIHKPKAAHSWREFAIEIGTIICGILIALGLEEGIRTLHERQVTTEAREAIRDEVRENVQFLKGRQATQECISRRLDELSDLLNRAGDGPLQKQPKWVGQPSIWYTPSQRWHVATASGRSSLFNNKEQGAISAFYTLSALMTDVQQKEQAAWAELRALETWPGPLGNAGHVHFVSALQQARYAHWQTAVIIGLGEKTAAALGVRGVKPHAMGDYDIPHAVCLSIDTPRDRAVAQLATGNPYPQPK